MVDTNVLIYSTVAGNPWHAAVRQWLVERQADGTVLCASPQVAREYLVALTRGEIFARSFTPQEALDAFATLRPSLEILIETEAAFERLLVLARRYSVRGKAVHDANIVATMQAHGVERLATYNEGDFARYTEITLEKLPPPDSPST